MADSLIETHYLPAALEALKAFPIQLEDIQTIGHSENVTFKIIPRDSQTHYALRLHRPGYTELSAHEQIYRRIGVMAAQSHNQSTGWNEPPGFHRRRLDAEGLVGEDPHWGRFWEVYRQH